MEWWAILNRKAFVVSVWKSETSEKANDNKSYLFNRCNISAAVFLMLQKTVVLVQLVIFTLSNTKEYRPNWGQFE